MQNGLGELMATLAVWVLPVLLAVTLHEAAHGYVANLFGDDTAKRAGRLTFNPLAHIDPFGTVLLPALLIFTTGIAFGYARPVPVDARNFANPKRDMVWVALAGPGANIGLALLGAILLPAAITLPEGFAGWAQEMLHVMVFFNCVIAIFNMLPVPPLDGGRVAVGLLPDALAFRYARLERYGMVVIIGLLFLLPLLGQAIGIAFNPARALVFLPGQALYDLILGIFG